MSVVFVTAVLLIICAFSCYPMFDNAMNADRREPEDSEETEIDALEV